jgi:hypothetical protein
LGDGLGITVGIVDRDTAFTQSLYRQMIDADEGYKKRFKSTRPAEILFTQIRRDNSIEF